MTLSEIATRLNTLGGQMFRARLNATYRDPAAWLAYMDDWQEEVRTLELAIRDTHAGAVCPRCRDLLRALL